MKCPACHYEQPAENTSCEACGLIFSKYDPEAVKPGSANGPAPNFPMGKIKTEVSVPGPGRRLRFINPFLYVSIIFLAYDIYAITGIWNFLANAQHATGQVLGIIRHGSGRMNSYCPQVEFTLPDGKVQAAEAAAGFSFTLPGKGEKIEVLYDPAHPENIRIDSFWTNWFPAVLWTLIVIPLLLVGFFPFFVD